MVSNCVWVFAVVWLVASCSAVPSTSSQIHRLMTSEELRRVFQVESHDQVPNYHLVHARSLHKRSTSDQPNKKEVHISAFGKDFRLQLERNDHLSKAANRLRMYEAQAHTDGQVNLTEIQLPANASDIGDVYQDDASGAAVLLQHQQDGTLMLDGTIGGGLTIKPAPSRLLLRGYPEDPSSIVDNQLPPEIPPGKATHIVYRHEDVSDYNGTTYSDYMFMEPDQLRKRSTRSERNRRESPEAVWPEILVVVDYDSYNMHGGNNMDIKKYFISFWNGVDLRYKLLGGPKVRISLAGIIISKGRDATPYLENNRVGGNAVDSAGALTELGKYLFRERRLPTYDIAVVVTKLDLCRREMSHGACNKGTAGNTVRLRHIRNFSTGFAYVGGACVVNKRLEKVNSVAIIEDTGGFSGIIVAAHEVGHLLGAVHDGSPPPSYLGGSGAEHCRWEDGYIMSDLRHTERGFKWSICSVQQFKHFLNGDTAKCLYNIPHEDDELPRLLPGKLLSLDSQCRKDRGTSACFKDDRVCAQLFCFDSRSGYCVSYRPAAEGSPCGDGQYCINGRCIPENENVIPDYSRMSEVVVPKPGGFQPSIPPPSTFDREDETDEELTTSTQVSFRRTAVRDDRLDNESSHQQPPLFIRTEKGRALRPASNRRRFISKIKAGEGAQAHFRRTSHLDSVEEPSVKEPSIIPPLNEVTKSPEKEVFQSEEVTDVGVGGCRDLMRELAGGLTCKQFLRRFGSRYCNHHYIINHCCSSRKLLCQV